MSDDGASGGIVLFGGTFDPPHIGHLAVAQDAFDSLPVRRVAWIPCGHPPHKPAWRLTSPGLRLEMTRAAIAEDERFVVSDVEVRRKGMSFTVDTIREVVAAEPRRDPFPADRPRSGSGLPKLARTRRNRAPGAGCGHGPRRLGFRTSALPGSSARRLAGHAGGRFLLPRCEPGSARDAGFGTWCPRRSAPSWSGRDCTGPGDVMGHRDCGCGFPRCTGSRSPYYHDAPIALDGSMIKAFAQEDIRGSARP